MSLRQVSAIVVLLAAASCATFKDIEDAANDGSVPAKLRVCRAEARAAFYVGQRSAAESMAVYDACKKREGL